MRTNILRIMAWGVDAAICLLASILIGYITLIASINLVKDGAILVACIMLVLFILYHFIAWKSSCQRTLGQLLLGLKLQSRNGSNLCFTQCIIKAVITGIMLFPVTFFPLLSILFSKLGLIGNNLVNYYFAALAVYIISINGIDRLNKVQVIKCDEPKKRSLKVMLKRVVAYAIDLLFVLQLNLALWLALVFVWRILDVTFFESADRALLRALQYRGDVAFVMAYNLFIVAYCLYYSVAWRVGYERTLGQLFLGLKASRVQEENGKSYSRKTKIFFLLLPILPFIIFLNYDQFISSFGEGGQYIIPFLILYGIAVQVICLFFNDRVDNLARMKIENANKKEV